MGGPIWGFPIERASPSFTIWATNNEPAGTYDHDGKSNWIWTEAKK